MPTAALYIYSAYSQFEVLVDHYMSDGVPIVPITPMDQLDGVSNSSYASLTNSTQQIQNMPVDSAFLRAITLLDH